MIATIATIAVLVPRAAILLASATDRELWRGPGEGASAIAAHFCNPW